MAEVTLYCFIHGDASGKIFPVKIDKGESIGSLKKAIWIEKNNAFQGVDASDLDIWRVQICVKPPDDNFTALKNNVSVDIENVLGGVQLIEVDDISEHFDNPPKKHIHVIVVSPAASKELTELKAKYEELQAILKQQNLMFQQFNLQIKGKRKPFTWKTNIMTTTLESVKSAILRRYSALSSEGFFELNFVTSSGEEHSPRNDEEFREMLALCIGSNPLYVTLDTPQKPFSDWNFKAVCELFQFTEDSDPTLAIFPKFNCGLLDVYDNILEIVVNELQTRIRTTPLDNTTREATKSIYVYSFLVHSVMYFPTDFCIRPEKNIEGHYGRGKVDYAIDLREGDRTVSVTEVKKEDFKQGVAQNVIELESTLSGRRKRKYGELNKPVDTEETVYGIVTDAWDWFFVECRSDENEKLHYSLSKMIRIRWHDKGFEEDVRLVLSHIIWILAECRNQAKILKPNEVTGEIEKLAKFEKMEELD